MHSVLSPRLSGYFVAAAAITAALLVRWLLDPLLGEEAPLSTVYGAIAIAAWYGGPGSALLVALVGYVAANILFTAPRGSMGFTGALPVLHLAFYAVSSFSIIALGWAARRARDRAASAASEALRHRKALETEIQQRKHAEESLRTSEQLLRESQERFQAFMDNAPARVAMKDSEGRYVFVNRAIERAFGSTAAQRVGHTDYELFPAETAEQLRSTDRLVMDSAEPKQLFETVPESDGDHHILTMKFPVRDARGNAYLGAVSIDITEQRRAEAALLQAREELQIITDTMSAPITRCSRDLRYLWVSKPYADWLGRPVGEITGRPIAEVVGAAAFEQLQPHFRAVLSGQKVQYEQVVSYLDIGPRWVSGVYTPTFDGFGRADGWVAVVTDIDQRKRIEEALKEADRRKDEFLATLAHELRNPLAPIRNAVAILKAKNPIDPELNWSRDVIERQVQQMARLLDDLLDVSRITRNKLQLRRQHIELSAAIQSAVETSRPLIDAGSHRLSIVLPAEPIHLHADLIRLAQVFSNLLNNAAKYTDRGGEIALAVERRAGEVQVSVRDSGMGVAADMLPRIFEPFTQAIPALERSQGGLGIGLSLVRGLIGMHGGSVEARSSGIGQGSEFIVRLPIAPADTRELESDAAEESSAREPHRIVVADDSRDAADSLARILEIMGHDAHAAYDGRQALELGERLRPDVMVLDIGMPNLNGYETARRVRSQPWGQGLLLIALTGWGQDDDKRRAAAAGFDRHLTKPVDPAVLNDLLNVDRLAG
jgi:PAS domain S-box-containing protein